MSVMSACKPSNNLQNSSRAHSESHYYLYYISNINFVLEYQPNEQVFRYLKSRGQSTLSGLYSGTTFPYWMTLKIVVYKEKHQNLIFIYKNKNMFSDSFTETFCPLLPH